MLNHFLEGFIGGLVVFLWFILGCIVGTYYAFLFHWLLGIVTIAVNGAIFMGFFNVAQHLIFPEKEKNNDETRQSTKTT